MLRHNRPAFSLVEILIVVTVIIILVAVLIPTLESAMGRAATAKCGSQLRQLGAGVLAYATDSGGVIPRVSSANDVLNRKYAPRWFLQDDTSTATPANDVVVWNLGFLWFKDTSPAGRVIPTPVNDEGYIRESKIFFCPAQAHEAFVHDTYASGGTTGIFPVPKDTGSEPTGEEKSGVRLSYYYNPIMENPHGGAPSYDQLFKRVSDLTGRQAPNPADSTKTMVWPSLLALDTIETSNADKFKTISHAADAQNVLGGWNILLGDNSVGFVADRRETTTILEDIDAVGTDLEKLQSVYRRLLGK